MTRTTRLVPGAGMVLGLAMGLSNALSYLVVVLLSGSLGPEDFGGFSALNTYGTLLAMPAGALQVVVARHSAHRPPQERTAALATATGIGVVLLVVSVLLAPLLTGSFSLPSAWAVVWLAAMLPPMTLTGACQGLLLGTEHLGRLSVLYVVTATTRLAAAATAVALSFGVTEVFAATFVASLLTVAVGRWLVRDLLPRRDALGRRTVVRDVVRSNGSLAALMALSSLDVLLARHYLTTAESGDYALAALFGRVVFWGTQFVALSLVPRMQHHDGGRVRATLHRAGLTVVLLGALVAAGCAVRPDLLVRVTGGAAYAGAEPLLAWYAVTGTLWALVQVLLFAEMAAGRHVLGRLVWGLTAVEVAVVALWAHDTPAHVLGATAATAAVAVVAGYLLFPTDRALPDAEEAELVEALGQPKE